MLKINEYNDIEVSYGDEAAVVFTIEGGSFKSGDVAVFAIKESIQKSAPMLWRKEVDLGDGATSFFVPLTADTYKKLDFQKDRQVYFYDVRIKNSNGGYTTPNAPCKFVVMGVVADG